MRNLAIMAVIFPAIMFVVSCAKDKPTSLRPEDQGHAVTLQYQNYYYAQGGYWYCIRLTMNDNPIERCGLGVQTGSLWTREYEWKLFVVGNNGQQDVYYQVASGNVMLDRNKTCLVNGNTITWQ